MHAFKVGDKVEGAPPHFLLNTNMCSPNLVLTYHHLVFSILYSFALIVSNRMLSSESYMRCYHDQSTIRRPVSDAATSTSRILAEIIELSILTSTPCPLVPDPSSSNGAELLHLQHLSGRLTLPIGVDRACLFVSKFFYSIARPLLLRTLTLDSDYAAEAFFAILEKDGGNAKAVLESVERAWLGNLSALGRED